MRSLDERTLDLLLIIGPTLGIQTGKQDTAQDRENAFRGEIF